MEDRKIEAAESEDISESFTCCVCLDLLCKPIVLACGHVSCFWCVHKSMNGFHESHCPICRNPYYHFPTICEMLHFLLLKMYPIAYRRRENQILEEEKVTGFFSPQFDAHAYSSPVNKTTNHLGDSSHGESRTNVEKSLEENSRAIPSDTVQHHGSPQNVHDHEEISVADVLCAACKKFLFRPLVLNCGHVFCESCIINPGDEMLKCCICQSSHPRGIPKVCLELDQFLKERFPEEYSLRRHAVQLNQVNLLTCDSPTICTNSGGKEEDDLPRWHDVASGVHFGAGCDYCGMFPMIGDRYRCKDCVEKMGFDLCSDCYNTRSKRPGRFNQQHTPEHKFELIRNNNSFLSNIPFSVVTRQLDDGSTAVFITNDESENSDDGSLIHTSSSSDANESDENTSASPVTSNGNEGNQNDSQPAS